MYTLYYLPGSCSLAVHVALIETGAAYRLVNVAVPAGQPRAPEFLALNPRGNVPVLTTEDGLVLREGVAILTYLLDAADSPLLPRAGLARTQAMEWLCFANASLHPGYGRVAFMVKTLGDAAYENPLYQPACASFQKLWDDVEAHLSDNRAYVCGADCTIADILVTIMGNWSMRWPTPMQYGPYTKAFFARVIARPSFQQALEAEGVKYKAA